MAVEFRNRFTGTLIYAWGDEDAYDTRAALVEAVATGVNLACAALEGAMGEINFDGLDLRTARVRMASFAGSSLRNSNLSGLNLYRSSFNGADIRDADFSKVVAQQSNFAGARADRANFNGADLRGTNRNNGTSFQYAVLTEAKLVGANVEWGNMDHAEADAGPDLTRAVFRNGYFNQTLLPNATIVGTNFDNSIWVFTNNIGGFTGA